MDRFDRKWVFIALALAVAVYAASLFAFPAWATSWRLLLVLATVVLVGVVSFIAAARGAFEKKDPAPTTPPQPPAAAGQSVTGNLEGDMIGRDQNIGQLAQRDIVHGDVHYNLPRPITLPTTLADQVLPLLPSPPCWYSSPLAIVSPCPACIPAISTPCPMARPKSCCAPSRRAWASTRRAPCVPLPPRCTAAPNRWRNTSISSPTPALG
jgi:hypothetical protein